VRSYTIVTDRRGIELFVWTRHTIKCKWSKGSLCACEALTRRNVMLCPSGRNSESGVSYYFELLVFQEAT
jgi:hypothetical protein